MERESERVFLTTQIDNNAFLSFVACESVRSCRLIDSFLTLSLPWLRWKKAAQCTDSTRWPTKILVPNKHLIDDRWFVGGYIKNKTICIIESKWYITVRCLRGPEGNHRHHRRNHTHTRARARARAHSRSACGSSFCFYPYYTESESQLFRLSVVFVFRTKLGRQQKLWSSWEIDVVIRGQSSLNRVC